jgi:soluble cytochrome b562
MRLGILSVAALIAGSATFVGFTKAEAPSRVTPESGNVVKLADEMPEVQHLREARHHLQDAKDAFEKDKADPANHRKEILEGMDKALDAIDKEIDELLGKK